MNPAFFFISVGRTLCLVILLLPASNVWSNEISFDYVQTDFISKSFNPSDSLSEVNGTGLGFALSLSVTPGVAVRLAVESTTLEMFQGLLVDTVKTTVLGFTAHTSIVGSGDIYATASALKAEITKQEGGVEISDSAMGFSIILGARYKLSDLMEVELSASHVNAFNQTVDSFAIDARYYFHPRLSVGFGFRSSDDVDSLLLSGRMDI